MDNVLLKISGNFFVPICGIYAITNIKNGSVYIGQSQNIINRWMNHVNDLNRGYHVSKKLVNDWIIYGAEYFMFEVIDIVADPENLTWREGFWFSYYVDHGTKSFYNNVIPAGAYSIIKEKTDDSYKRISEIRERLK